MNRYIIKKNNEKCIYRYNQKGFTLVETMVVVFIFTAMSASIVMTLAAGRNSWEVNKATMEMQQSLRIAAERMKEELQQAGSSSIVNVDADGSWYTNVEFRIPESVDSSGNITWPSDTTKFLLGGSDSKQLIRRFAEGKANESEMTIARNIKTLKFRRQIASPKIIEIYMDAEMKIGTGANKDISYDANVELRN